MDSNGLSFWMLSQLNDWLPPWRATTAYVQGQGIVDRNGNIQIAQNSGTSDAADHDWNATIGQTTADAGIAWMNSGPGMWTASTGYVVGQYILDLNSNLQRVVAVTGVGTTGAVEPTWPVAFGQPVQDGNVTWSCAGPSQAGLFYCSKNNTLQLRSMRTGSPPAEDFNTATSMVASTPMTLDQFGNYARWDASSGLVVAGGSGPSDAPPPNEVPIYAPGQPEVTDVAMGYDGILYIAVGGSLVMVDRRDRWPNYTLTVADFSFWRLAALPEGGVLALDRNQPQLGKVSGQPLQTGPIDTPDPGIMRPCQANPNPPQIVSRYSLPAGETFVALAPMDMTQQPAQFVVMSWSVNSASNQVATIRIFNETTLSGTPVQLGGVRLPYAIAWLGNQQFAVFTTNLNEALIYDLSDAGDTLVPAGETYILAREQCWSHGSRFHICQPTYANVPGATPVMLPLLPLSLNNLALRLARPTPQGPAIIDSGIDAMRLASHVPIEAIVPPRCGAHDLAHRLRQPHRSCRSGVSVVSAHSWRSRYNGDSIPQRTRCRARQPRSWQSHTLGSRFCSDTCCTAQPIEDTYKDLFMVLVQRDQQGGPQPERAATWACVFN
jgi:hypothetical protein